MRVFISGPMSGMLNFNREAFNERAKELKGKGYNVCNPVTFDDGSSDKEWTFYMRLAIKHLAECDGMYQLAGWKESPGALIEFAIAKSLGLIIWGEDQ